MIACKNKGDSRVFICAVTFFAKLRQNFWHDLNHLPNFTPGRRCGSRFEERLAASSPRGSDESEEVLSRKALQYPREKTTVFFLMHGPARRYRTALKTHNAGARSTAQLTLFFPPSAQLAVHECATSLAAAAKRKFFRHSNYSFIQSIQNISKYIKI